MEDDYAIENTLHCFSNLTDIMNDNELHEVTELGILKYLIEFLFLINFYFFSFISNETLDIMYPAMHTIYNLLSGHDKDVEVK